VSRPPFAAVLATAIALATAAPAAAQMTLVGTINEDATISFLLGGMPFTHLAPGAYSAEVTDNAISHNFHVIGPGVDQATSIDGTGMVTWPLTLGDGFYDWQCDVHPTAMFGHFTVGNVLTVVKNGTGGGSVSSNPAGITCGGTCRAARSLRAARSR
jgi:hypothetical protein